MFAESIYLFWVHKKKEALKYVSIYEERKCISVLIIILTIITLIIMKQGIGSYYQWFKDLNKTLQCLHSL